MAGCRSVQNGDIHAIVHHVEHAGHQKTGIQHDGLTGFQIDFDVVGLAQMGDDAREQVDVVSVAGDVMSAAQIEPL